MDPDRDTRESPSERPSRAGLIFILLGSLLMWVLICGTLIEIEYYAAGWLLARDCTGTACAGVLGIAGDATIIISIIGFLAQAVLTTRWYLGLRARADNG